MKTKCPHCGQHFEVDAADVGKNADCVNCGRRFVIKNSVDPNSQDGADAREVQSDALGGDHVKIFRWIRTLASVICVVVAMYQMYDIRNGLKDSLKDEDSAIRAISRKTWALVDLMEPVMLMLLAIFIKPGDKNEK